jgi:hypothetical protein
VSKKLLGRNLDRAILCPNGFVVGFPEFPVVQRRVAAGQLSDTSAPGAFGWKSSYPVGANSFV